MWRCCVMNKRYTYLIGWSQHNKYYYGVRISDSVVNPEYDLWNVYKTSSKVVKAFYKQHGEPDIIQVRRTFVNKEDALKWERKVLKRMDVVNNPKFLNMNNGSNQGLMIVNLPKVEQKIEETNMIKYGTPYTTQLDVVKEAREKASYKKYGASNPVYSEEFQNHVREKQKTTEYKEKMSNSLKKTFENYDWTERNKKIQETNFERYGVSCSMNTQEQIALRNEFVLNCPYNCSKAGGQLFRESKKEFPLCYHWTIIGFVSHMIQKHQMTKTQARALFQSFKQPRTAVEQNKHQNITLEMAGLS